MELVCSFVQNFNPHPVLAPMYVRPDQVERALKARFHEALTNLPPPKKELDLLIVILPDNNGSLYGEALVTNRLMCSRYITYDLFLI